MFGEVAQNPDAEDSLFVPMVFSNVIKLYKSNLYTTLYTLTIRRILIA